VSQSFSVSLRLTTRFLWNQTASDEVGVLPLEADGGVTGTLAGTLPIPTMDASGELAKSRVIDRGSEQGLRPGQRLTIFRRAKRGNAPQVVGDGVVVAVRADSATIRVEHSTDVVFFGDFVAPQKSSQRSN
jgi:hypothetical protein